MPPLPNIIRDLEGTAETGLAGGAATAAGAAFPVTPGSIIPGVADIGHFFDVLASGALWIRVAEVILGAGLIIVGLATLVSGPVGQAAARAGKAAAIL